MVSPHSSASFLFLALFPAILFLLALASFFPLSNVTDAISQSLGPFVSPQILGLIEDQMSRLADNDSGGLLTLGVFGALWSSSAALASLVSALNRAYDIEEGRPWWRVRLIAIGLTLAMALLVLTAMSLVLLGPTWADFFGRVTGWGTPFKWTWLVLQWPLVFALVATGIGVVYYYGPDADQDWVWIMPARWWRRCSGWSSRCSSSCTSPISRTMRRVMAPSAGSSSCSCGSTFRPSRF